MCLPVHVRHIVLKGGSTGLAHEFPDIRAQIVIDVMNAQAA